MSTPKHTPGPWHIGLKPGPLVYGPQGEQIVGLNVMLDSDEVLANAKFIAAAPAMYEALLLAVQALEELAQHPAFEGEAEEFNAGGYGYSALNKAQTALAQAEGNE